MVLTSFRLGRVASIGVPGFPLVMASSSPSIHVPKPFRDAVWIAVEYNTSHVGPEHVLVAVLRSPGPCDTFLNRTLPGTALQDGIALLHGAQTVNDQSGLPRPDDSPRPSPAFYRALGRADAFAAALGDGRSEEVAALLTLWWDDAAGLGSVLRRWGIGESDIDALLHETGYSTPRSYPKT